MIEYIDTYFSLEDKLISNLEVINIGFEQCSSEYSYGPHIRPYNLIHFVTSGSGTLIINNVVYHISAGDAFIIPAEEISLYKADMDNPWEYYWIGFAGFESNKLINNLINSLDEHFIIRNINVNKYAMQISQCKQLSTVNTANHFKANSILYAICCYLSEDILSNMPDSMDISLVDEIKFYLDSKYTEKIQLKNLAETFHIHPNYLTRIFKKAFLTTPKQYLIELKMNKAKQLLSTTNMPINIIASSLGFDDQLTFSKAFHLKYGISPSEYKRYKKSTD